MRIIQRPGLTLTAYVISFLLSGMFSTAGANPLDDSTLADQALAIIGADVPNSTHKCAACHEMSVTKLRAWTTQSATVLKDCLPLPAEQALACLSRNGSIPYQWTPKKLGLWAARVKSEDFTPLFETVYGATAQQELNRFRQRAFMPRSGGPGFTDAEWAIVYEYINRGAPLLEQKLGGLSATEPMNVKKVTIEDKVLHDDLQNPWSVNASPDGDIWVTELDGQIKIFDGKYKLKSVLKDLPDLKSVGQGGLLDLAFHPNFLQNRWVYINYVVEGPEGNHTRVNRFTYRDGKLSEHKILLDGPSSPDRGAHFGSRLVFDQNGFLYASFGERHQKEKAQSLDSYHGKIVRMTDEGAIPADNPFPGKYIYTYGHRNPQGLALNPVTGQLFDSEHGPTGYDAPGGGDEINLLKPGANYGWPLIHHRDTRAGMESPIQEWTPAIAPSGIAFYTGDKIPEWKNDLFVAALAGASLFRLTLDANGKITGTERLLEDKYGRIRDVGNAPDGTLLIVTDDGQLVQLKGIK